MEITSKRSDADVIELTVTIPADEVQKSIKTAYKEAGKVRIPGFRPGKAPRQVLENHYGGKEYFQAKATDELVNEKLPLAIDAEGHVPLDKPNVEELELVEEGSDYSFKASFTVRPILEVSSFDPLQIELPSEEATPEEIEQQLDTMLDYYADFAEVTDRPVEAGDFLILQIESTNGEERLEGLSGEAVPYQLGSGGLPASFDEHLIGAAIGETRTFDFSLNPEADGEAADAGATHVVATVKEIKTRIKPELTDAWVKEKIEFESVDELKSRIADSIKGRKQSELASLKEQLITEELAARLVGEPPALLLAQTEQGIYRDFFTSLQRRNQNFDDFLANTGLSPDAFRENIHEQAVLFASQALALDAFARHLALEVTEDEIRQEFVESGVGDPEALYQEWKDNGRISELREGILRMKATQHINENVEVLAPGTKPAAAKTKTKSEAKPAAAKTKKAKATEKAEKEPGGKETVTKKAPKAKKADTED
ncbi:MAG: trigger factor [Coriobacteriales bacterium]|nr:trigger factor [Coriobacteriales bacterium]